MNDAIAAIGIACMAAASLLLAGAPARANANLRRQGAAEPVRVRADDIGVDTGIFKSTASTSRSASFGGDAK